MPQVHASVFIKATDQLRVRPRQAGGFHVLVGDVGVAEVMISFDSCATAEILASLLTTAAITHGDLAQAIATASAILAGETPREANVVRPNFGARPSDQPTPPSAA